MEKGQAGKGRPSIVPEAAPQDRDLRRTYPLDARSVLATPYAPQKLRNVIYEPVTMPMLAAVPQSLENDIEQVHRWSVPPVPSCVCRNARHDSKPRMLQPRSADLEERDFREALGPKLDHEERPLPSVHAIDDLSDYVRTFQALLQSERKAVLRLYERYSQSNLHLQILVPHLVATGESPHPLSVRLMIPGIADVRPQIQPNDHVLFRPLTSVVTMTTNPYSSNGWPAEQTVEVQARVQRVLRRGSKGDAVHTSWLDMSGHQFLKQAYDPDKNSFYVRFVPSATLHERMLMALQWLESLPAAFVGEMLFPSQVPSLPRLPSSMLSGDDSRELNDKQQAFVDMVMLRTRQPSRNAVRPPMCLTGPAGTGKTLALLEAVLGVLADDQTHRILVCTPSHTAADVITRRLAKDLPNRTQLFRLYDADRPIATVPVELLAYAHFAGKKGTFAFPPMKKWWKFRVVVCTCSDASLLYQAGLTNEQLRSRRRCYKEFFDQMMDRSDLSGSLEGIDRPYFTHLFVDEAAQAKEPETLIPLSVVVDPLEGTRKVEIAFVGDPRQLSPQTYSNGAAEAGLGQSFLERLLLRSVNCLQGQEVTDMLGPDPRTMEELISYAFQDQLSVVLTMNYRGHPSFLMMPSVLFYFDKLQGAKGVAPAAEWCTHLRRIECLSTSVGSPAVTKKQKDWPIHFRGVIGKDASVSIETMVGGNSWSNRTEAKAVVEIVSSLMQFSNVSSQSIGVMAPFRGQVVLIRQLLRDRNMGAVDVGTIEDYQAVERDVIVLSLTRSTEKFIPHDIEHRMGVFRQPKRTNVALTRAENLLIVVGNPQVMWNDAIWCHWLLFCLRNGLWYGESSTQAFSANGSSSNGIDTALHVHGNGARPAPESPPLQNNVDGALSSLERLCR